MFSSQSGGVLYFFEFLFDVYKIFNILFCNSFTQKMLPDSKRISLYPGPSFPKYLKEILQFKWFFSPAVSVYSGSTDFCNKDLILISA